VLGERVQGARILDLFAGSGVVGFEALSRGARIAVFVDNHRSAVRLIESNRSELGIDSDRTRILRLPAEAALDRLDRAGESFDLAWADPPFESWRDGLDAVIAAFDRGILEAEATACLECPARADVAAALPKALRVERDLGGGASRVVLIVRGRPREHAGL
jgi:16S rRNA (guanine966-N2)-methyltransferase